MSGDHCAGPGHAPHRLPPGAARADSELRQLTVAGKPFYMLRQRGRFADIAYDHGRLLAREIEQGVFPEILSAIARGTDLGSRLKSGVAAGPVPRPQQPRRRERQRRSSAKRSVRWLTGIARPCRMRSSRASRWWMP